MVAGHLALIEEAQFRHLGLAALGRIGAAFVEGTTAGWVERVGEFALDLDLGLARIGVDSRSRRQQRLGVGVQRTLVELVRRSDRKSVV